MNVMNVTLPPDRPRLPEAEYEGRIIRCFQWPTYWRQELTTWDKQTGRVPLNRWVAIYDVQLRRGLTRPAHDAVLEWRRQAERWPVVPINANYYTEPNKTAIARLTRSSTLYKMLQAARRARHPEHTVFFVDAGVDLKSPVGLDTKVLVSLTTQTTEVDPRTKKSKSVKLERDADGRLIDPRAYSVVSAVLSMSIPKAPDADALSSVLNPLSSVLNPQASVLSPSPSAFSASNGVISQTCERDGSHTPIGAEASDGGINQAGSSSAGAVTAIAHQATATAPDARHENSDANEFVPQPALSQREARRRLQERYGREYPGIVGRRGPCRGGGDALYARDGESPGWCARCDA
jgi:hypothetical protein